jgi:hypothetical protein
MKKIPQSFQGLFWSVRLEDLDLEKDKIYIINQTLAYGGLEELRWLFKTYPKEVIKEIFINQPIKTYRASAFNFVKKILLGIEEPLPEERYVINTPRIIR